MVSSHSRDVMGTSVFTIAIKSPPGIVCARRRNCVVGIEILDKTDIHMQIFRNSRNITSRHPYLSRDAAPPEKTG